MDVLDACLSGRKAPGKQDEPLPTDSHYDFLERWEEDEIGSDDMDDGWDPGPGPLDDY